MPLELPGNSQAMALGAQQKCALALCNGAQAVLGGHVGDMDTLSSRDRFVDQVQHLTQLYLRSLKCSFTTNIPITLRLNGPK